MTVGLPGEASFVTISRDGRYFASGGGLDHPIGVWEVATGKLLRNVTGDRLNHCAAFTPDGQGLLAAVDDKATIWNIATGKIERSFSLASDSIMALTCSPDGKTLAVGSSNHDLSLYDLATGREQSVWPAHRRPVGAMAFSSDNRTIVTVCDNGRIKVWDVQSGREQCDWAPAPPATICKPVITADGRSVAYPARDHYVHIVTSATGKLVNKIRVNDHRITPTAVAISPDRTTLATCDASEPQTRFWSIETGKQIGSVGRPSQTVGILAYSNDGKILAAGGQTDVFLCRIADYQPLHQWKIHEWASIDCFAFSPDGSRLAVCANGNTRDDHIVQVWDSAAGRALHKLKGHVARVVTVAFTPDGRALASGSDDGVILLWDSVTGNRIREIKTEAGVATIRFSQDGKLLASSHADTTVLIWDVGEATKSESGR
jgi:WD40 repeat protein